MNKDNLEDHVAGGARYKLALSALLSCCLASGTQLAAGSHDHKAPYCSQTTSLAFRACRHDVRDDTLLAKANCVNISDREERKECREESKEEQVEARQLCKDQRKARFDVCDQLGEARYDPEFDPENFVDPMDIGNGIAPNPYFPLIPGLVRVYEGGGETITVTVTNETIIADGVTCRVVRDIVEEDGEVIEDTSDFYAQHVNGDVWYCGEIARNFEKGILKDLDGSFLAGEESAKAGILIRAMPVVGEVYRQEWSLAEAEDVVEVLSTMASEMSPAANCLENCIQTRDFTPLEPDVEENKFYAPGIGVIVEYDVEDPEERTELVDIIFP